MNKPIGFEIIDNVIDNCELIIDWLEEKNWNPSSYGPEFIVDDFRNSKTQFVSMLSWDNPPFIHETNKRVWASICDYAKKWNFPFYNIEDVSIQKYQKEERYGVHIDAGPNSPRVCSALLYLNDNFEGGKTYFPHFDFSITPKTGRLVIFPSNYIYAHEAQSVILGTKYAAAYWVNG